MFAGWDLYGTALAHLTTANIGPRLSIDDLDDLDDLDCDLLDVRIHFIGGARAGGRAHHILVWSYRGHIAIDNGNRRPLGTSPA